MGRVFKPKYAWTKKDGTHIEKVTKAWYIEYTDAAGRWVRRKAGTTKEQATDALRKAESDVLAERNGLPTQRSADIPCSALAKHYLTALKPHIAPKQYQIHEAHLKAIFKHCRIHLVRQITPERIEHFLASLDDRGSSPRTVNTYLQSIKGMLNWAVKARRLPFNPLDCVAKRSEAIDRRRVRRALSTEELTRLLAVAPTGPMLRHAKAYKGAPVPPEITNGLEREGLGNTLIYRLLAQTGLRVNEVRSLVWADLDLKAKTLTTRPHWTGNKNGKEEVLPLPADLVEALKSWHALTKPNGKAVVVHVPKRILNTFYKDLELAGIKQEDDAGRIVDLHAMRHTYGTRLVEAGVDIKAVQTLMRHSTPTLTLAIYVHTDRVRLAQAVATLPRLGA